MFAQVASAILGVFLLYIGFIDSSVINILLGISMLLSSAGMLYAAKAGSSFQEGVGKWVAKREKKTDKR